MNILHIVLLILAFICFLLSAAGITTRVNLQSLGLGAWVLAVLLAAAK